MLGKRRSCKNSAFRDAREFLKEHEASLEAECLARVQCIRESIQDLKPGWERRANENLAFVTLVNRAREQVRGVRLDGEKSSKEAELVRYEASSLFLIECWRYLTEDPEGRERMHLVTGPITQDGARVLSRIERVKIAESSAAYVRADETSTHQRLARLDEQHGHLPLAMFHSHMSDGAKATAPSGTDIQNQERFVKVGCDALGGIFSLDGYARFFSTCQDFEMRVFGKGVECVSEKPREKVYRLPSTSEVSQ